MPEPILLASGLTRRFGGLVAVDAVALALAPGAVHCIIGPNGAGKTTLINLLSGDLAPDAGEIRYAGRDIAGWPTHRIARLGIQRSYQKTNIFPELTVSENVWLSAQARFARQMRFFSPAHRLAGVAERVEASLERIDLAARASVPAGILSHGEQRQLEIGLMLAAEPDLLLLDEPMAGMSADETSRMVTLLNRLKGAHTLLLIEHDMDAVFAVADSITVMVNGAVLETGLPETIRRSPRVRSAYLGDGEGP
ncbi:MAG: ABC transporter ATP-binding protein [Proteobacteria bacterium]|nr:ABC transporter ATP-binding protein [Pseudomonadota bacterium]MBI3496389.1 ABC transporter ATP-binding protein [Pseudomonadota bacterium]